MNIDDQISLVKWFLEECRKKYNEKLYQENSLVVLLRLAILAFCVDGIIDVDVIDDDEIAVEYLGYSTQIIAEFSRWSLSDEVLMNISTHRRICGGQYEGVCGGQYEGVCGSPVCMRNHSVRDLDSFISINEKLYELNIMSKQTITPGCPELIALRDSLRDDMRIVYDNTIRDFEVQRG